VTLFCSPGCERTGPVCDFCIFFRFNGDSEGYYIGKGMCTYPTHQGPTDPSSECPDFHCANRADADPEQAVEYKASVRREHVPHVAG
jgi:hypothetical protein